MNKKIILAIGFLILLAGGILAWQYFGKPEEKLEKTIPFKVLKDEREIAFLQGGDIWVLSRDLKEKFKLIDTMEKITNFSFSPDGRIIYWLNEKGELWKKREGLTVPLARKDKPETIKNFGLSPDGKYIVYEPLVGYVGKDLRLDVPITSLWIMTNDGRERIKVERLSDVEVGHRPLVRFSKWFSNSKRILFYFQAADEVTQGSPFFEVGIDGKNPKVYPVTGYDNTYESIFETEPFFSPDGSRAVYFAILKGGIWLENIDGTDKAQILKGDFWLGRPIEKYINWSEDGKLLAVSTDRKVFIFDRQGNIISELEIIKAEEGNEWNVVDNIIISPDKKYITGRRIIDHTETLFLANISTKKIKKFEYPTLERIPTECGYTFNHLFFSKTGNRLYYLLRFYQKKMEIQCPPQQLWVIDMNTGESFMIMDDVSQIRRIP